MEQLCHVCGKPLGREDVATCMICRRNFHLAETQDSKTEDCGQVWISGQTMALRFMCNHCIEQGHPQD